MKRIITFSFCLFFMVTAVLIGCSSQKEETIRVAEVTRSIFYAPQYVAIEKGFFKDEGLTIDLKTTWGGDKTMTTLLSDGADVALVGSETSIYVSVRGSKDPVINFAQLTQTDGTFLVARDATKNFQFSDLLGKTFLGQRKGGMPQMVGEYVLKKNGIDPKQDLTLMQNIDFQNIPNAFASGTGDYVQLFEPQASLFERQGIGHIVASFGKETPHLPYTVFMAKKSYLEKNHDTMVRFTRALYKAQTWVDTHSEKEIAKVIAPYFENTPQDVIATVVKRYKEQGSYATNPLLEKEEWNQLQTIMQEANELPKNVPYSKLVDLSIAKEAIKQ